MSLLTVQPADLDTLAKQCQGWSREVSFRTAPGTPAASAQATAAAVEAAHASAGLAGAALSRRMSTTAGHLSTAASGFTAEDISDAAVLAGLSAGR